MHDYKCKHYVVLIIYYPLIYLLFVQLSGKLFCPDYIFYLFGHCESHGDSLCKVTAWEIYVSLIYFILVWLGCSIKPLTNSQCSITILYKSNVVLYVLDLPKIHVSHS